MSVIIKGMKLPKGCDSCELVQDYDEDSVCCPFLRSESWYGTAPDYRLEHCLLIEIPTPHGRLIDADKLQTAIHGCLCETCQTFPCEKGIGCLIEDVFNLLDEAPTIIESEVSE